MSALLSAQALSKHFTVRGNQTLVAVNEVTLQVQRGEVLCVVGESGCGKSTLARVLVGLYDPTGGEVHFQEKRVDNLPPKECTAHRRAMQMIFQNPYESLNPRMTIRQTLHEAIAFHFPALSRAEREERALKVLEATGLAADAMARYPHQFSGGQRQRLSIARALSVQPECIIADEPVAALDVSVQAQILNLLSDLRDERELAYLFITHDLSVVEHFGDRVAVMYLGSICEMSTCAELFSRPRHPYTQILLQASPRIGKPLQPPALTGEPPSPLALPSGCVFHPRCPHATDRCRQEVPMLQKTDDGKRVIACHAVEEGAIT